MDWRQIIESLNDTTVKAVLVWFGGFLWKRYEPLVNKAIPAALTIGSAALSTLQLMFPMVHPDARPASFVFTSIAGAHLFVPAGLMAHTGSWLWNTLAPVAFAIAIQSGSKNTSEWVGLGFKLLWPNRRPTAG
jgi:hypothetical protein